MCNIDSLFDRLSIRSDENIREEAIKEARDIKSICVFLMPETPEHGRDIWESCARILAERTDEELLAPNIAKGLIDWISDMSFPGADIIEERLRKLSPESIVSPYTEALEAAILKGEKRKSGFLAEFAKDDARLFSLLDEEHKNLVMGLLTSPEKDHRETLIKLINEREGYIFEKARLDMENYISKVGDNLDDAQRAFLRSLVQG
jgi:hypothetical protein